MSNVYHIAYATRITYLCISVQNKSRNLCQTIDIFFECVIIISEIRIERLRRREQIWTTERWLNE